jgi:eukaryotic-like serine/threonine-protein kinase
MQGSDGSPRGTIPVRSGDVLAGKYRVDRILGVGGMGIVVAATHLQLHQKIALKFMLPEATHVPALLERFAREARAAAGLKSDHVARVLDVGTLDSGSPYMVMEYLEGSDLGSVIETRGALSIDVAVDYLLQACDAVAEAHSIGIVHRDLKPRNLFLTQRNDGRALVKVLDFGIAKQKAAASDLSLTKTSEVMGSPNYMSPEQLRASRAADERSDIWALGVILYELLTGVLPFAADSVTQLIAMVLTDHPRPIRAFRPDLPDDLCRAIERCLAKDPAARFATIAELALALERFAPADTRDLAARIGRITGGSRPRSASASSGMPAPELARQSRVRIAALAAVVVVLGLLGVIGAAAISASRPHAAPPGAALSSPATTTRLPATEITALAVATTPAPGPAAPPALSPIPTTTADGGPARIAHPRHDPVAPAASTPAASASASEPPRYRTTW